MNFLSKSLRRFITTEALLRQSPKDPAYFTGNPAYYNCILSLNGYLDQLKHLEIPSTPGYTPTWMSPLELEKSKSMQVKPLEYNHLIAKLDLLYQTQDIFEDSEQIKSLLAQFLRPGTSLNAQKMNISTLDEHGRSLTYGSRKTAKAQVWMIPGQGEIRVNGMRMAEYFIEKSHVHQVVKALDAVDGFGKWNVWSIVKGGGKSSQSKAVGVALARGIAIHDPSMADLLKEQGLTKIDTRQVERKKTNQPKARKKITWVKR